MGALKAYLEKIPDTFDVSTLMDPDVERIESTVYEKPLIYKYYPATRRSFFEIPKVRISQRDVLNDPFEMSRRWKSNSLDGLRKYAKSRILNIVPTLLSDPEFLFDRAIEHFATEGKTLSIIDKAKVRYALQTDIGKSLIEDIRKNAEHFIPSAIDYVFFKLESGFEKTVEGIVSNWGVLSLTEDSLNPLMWARYASEGTGFVIGFDASHTFFSADAPNKRKNLLRKVVYTNNWIDDFWRNPYYLFLVKSRDWEYEREWRLVKLLSEYTPMATPAGPAIYLCDLPRDLIKTVHFGYKYSETDLNDDKIKILNFGAQPDFHIVQLDPDTGQLISRSIEDDRRSYASLALRNSGVASSANNV